jgi:hypothetical protein
MPKKEKIFVNKCILTNIEKCVCYTELIKVEKEELFFDGKFNSLDESFGINDPLTTFG